MDCRDWELKGASINMENGESESMREQKKLLQNTEKPAFTVVYTQNVSEIEKC